MKEAFPIVAICRNNHWYVKVSGIVYEAGVGRLDMTKVKEAVWKN